MPRNVILAAFLCATVGGCATSQQVPRSEGRAAGATEHLISCSFFNWYLCYEQADKICPGRYKVLSESEGVARRELRIACPAA